jgi:hypothetical protein
LLPWVKKISEEVHITLVLSDNFHGSGVFEEFCSRLSSLVPKIVVQRETAEEDRGLGIEIGNRLCYRAVPLGPELEPFLEAILLQEGLHGELTSSIYEKLDKIRAPAMLKLYIAPQCPFCPTAVRKLVPLTIASEYVYLEIIDGVMFPETAEADGINSAPTIVFNDFKWSGSVQLQEVVDVISSQDPADLSAAALKNMIQEGGAMTVAQLMIEEHKIFPGLIDLLVDEKWPVRLGAMVVIEEIMEHDPDLASQVVEPVWGRFRSLDDQAKGDMIYLMGETGSLDTVIRLKRACNGLSSDELRTVAAEAIESIEGRHIK